MVVVEDLKTEGHGLKIVGLISGTYIPTRVDALVFRHIHRSVIKQEEGALFVNSETQPTPSSLSNKADYRIVENKKKRIEPEVIKV